MAATLALTLALLTGAQDPVQTPPVQAPPAQAAPAQAAPAQAAPAQAPAETTTFTDPALGLSFAHPTNWTTVATPVAPPAPKGKGNRFKLPTGRKKDKAAGPPEGMVTFSIPGPSDVVPAELTIVRASFSDAPEKWQQLQADANRNQKRDVEQQWQQEILGVPLLLTRISYVDNGTAMTTVTGLLYNAAPYKLLFRLSGPTSGFDAAQYQFTQAMETLRTTNDALPTIQEPGKPIAAPVTPTPDAKHPILTRTKAVLQEAPLALPVTVGGRKMILRVPEGWTLAAEGGDGATLRHAGLREPVTVKLYATATAPRPTETLSAVSMKSLDGFKTVDLREDTPGTPNRAGNPVLAIWRKGTGAAGPLAAMDAVAVAGDYYALFSFKPTPGDAMKDERKTVQAMLDAVGLVPAP